MGPVLELPGCTHPNFLLTTGPWLGTAKRNAYLFPNAVTMASKELSYLSKGRLCPERVDSMNSDSPKYFLLSGYKSAP